MSCVSESDCDEFLSCAGEDVAEGDSQVAAIRVDAVGSATIRVDAAENGPTKVGVPGGDSSVGRSTAAERDGNPAFDSAESPPGVVSSIREHFGLSHAHARLLTTAAIGCPDSDASGPADRVRGVFPLPYLTSERATPGAPCGGTSASVEQCRRRTSSSAC